MTNYLPTIGLEIHAELGTKSKMFCGCTNDPHGGEPNVHVCPICMAHPGTLPVVNKEAVRSVLLLGEAVGAKLATFTEFDRKNYFYPDIPKAYQISQYEYPLVKGGEICGIAITRVHLEEDTARSQHSDEGHSIVDFNRAGVPLMELVTEPVITSSEEAVEFAMELQRILRTLKISGANMERGEMRVEANISIHKDGEPLGTLVEVKNLNSFRSVGGAIEYELKRQQQLLEAGEKVTRETRGWDETKQRTFSQRTKETADDYRYFPDPDIPKFSVPEIDEFSKARLDEIMPILPSEKREIYKNLGLKSNLIETLISDMTLDDIFATLFMRKKLSNSELLLASNYITTDVSTLLERELSASPEFPFENFEELIAMTHAGEISSRVAKDLLPEILFKSVNPRKAAIDRNLLQSSSEEDLKPLIHEIIAENKSVVDDYKNGKEAALQFLVGQGMKRTQGSANPEILKTLFKDTLS